MSHAATNWAISQRGLKPATKIVLWHLADCHNAHTGDCFPSQERLAHDCEMSRSTVNLHLSKLEELGLIRRVQRVNESTKKQESTAYILALKGAFPVSENKTRAVSEKSEKPCPKNDDSRVRNSDTNPVREPGIEPVNARECANDLFSENGDIGISITEPDQIAEGFKQFWAQWPSHPRKFGKVDCEKKYRAACEGKHPKFDGIITPEQINRAAVSYVKSQRDGLTYLKGTLAWLNGAMWSPWLDCFTPEYDEADLTQNQRRMLQDGRCPPSLLVDNKPGHVALYWLNRYGHGGRK